jgi:hypothetical protein
LDLVNLDVDLTLQQTAPGGAVTIAAGHGVDVGAGAISLNLADLVTADLLNGVNFTVFVTTGCTATTDINSVRINADYTLSLLAGGVNVELTDGTWNTPIQTAGDPVSTLPGAAGTNVNFGTINYNGSGYPTTNAGSIGITVTQPTIGCAAPDWDLQVTTSDMNRSGGGGTIPANNLAYVSATATDGNLVPLGSGTALGTTATTIADGTDLVATGATLNVIFSVSPPATAPTGSYSGTITFSIVAGP